MKESEWEKYVATVSEADLSDEEFDWYHNELRKRRQLPIFYQYKANMEEIPKTVELIKGNIGNLVELINVLAESLNKVMDANEELKARLAQYEQE